MVSHWSLSDSKSPQVFITLLSILADPQNAAVWMFSSRPLISKFSSPCINPLVNVPSTPITIGITVTFMCFIVFSVLKQGLGIYLSFCFLSIFLSGLSGRQSPLFFFSPTSSDRLVIRLYLKIPEEFVHLMFQDRFWVMHIPFIRMVKLKFLHNSLLITFVTQSWLVLYSFCVNLLHSFVTWLIVSSLSQHNQHLLFCCILSIHVLT